ncbi:hypothetical protein ACFVS2_21130 [Brevibacillus sp. NPDC058079]|uniref:hypothetical protein n=1 Tax=Brevibacillus sp. NPDC058079 TaxID=3346330 RepID=UPI0036E7667D
MGMSECLLIPTSKEKFNKNILEPNGDLVETVRSGFGVGVTGSLMSPQHELRNGGSITVIDPEEEYRLLSSGIDFECNKPNHPIFVGELRSKDAMRVLLEMQLKPYKNEIVYGAIGKGMSYSKIRPLK